jgi:ABC-type uncharacterized transport system substrate-binding protein
MLPLWLGSADAIRSAWKARVHHAAGRRGDVAARGARAAGGDAGDWISPWRIACRLDGPAAWISSGPEGRGLRRGRERGDRVPLGGGAVRSSAGIGSRSDPSSGDRARRDHHSWGLAAKTATTTIPIVFLSAEDPVRLGLVASLARPGGNLTGINFFNVELRAKRLALLRELVPGASRVAVLLNPSSAVLSESARKDVETAARDMGLQIQVLNASTSREIDAAFPALVRERVDALFVSPDGFFNSRRVQLANMAARHVVPITSATREIVEAGGLMSYGSNMQDVWRQVGAYAGRILKGAKPADLPVVQSSKFELVINAQTARMLGLTIPPGVLAIADEVVE